jgi:2,4-dienoyl-CoA reductase-like NADH-dependent reductase (Old Yellow Enzyme family)
MKYGNELAITFWISTKPVSDAVHTASGPNPKMSSSKLAEPVTLPCGLTLPNRLAKAATTEQMSDANKLPTKQVFHRAYRSWGQGGWGMLMTGNVQVDLRYLGAMDDTAIDLHKMDEDHVHAAYRSLVETCTKEGTPTLMQINHTGRQSPLGAGSKGFCEKALAPSAVPIDFGPGIVQRVIRSVVFGTPREMTKADIDDVVERFATAARIASETGFAGVEIHAAHGYLLAQFLSARTNLRTDEYGGSARARAKVVVDVIKAIRAVVPEKFAVGIKLNSVDHQYGSSGEGQEKSTELDDALEQAKIIAEAGIDFLEISGGSYENPVVSCFGSLIRWGIPKEHLLLNM